MRIEMNNLEYINNMGTTPISELEIKTIKTFIKNNQSYTDGMSEKEVYIAFKNSTSFSLTRLSVAMSEAGTAIKESFSKDIAIVKKWWEFWK